MRFVATLRTLLLLALVAVLLQALYAFSRARPQDLPWTALDLGRPIGLFTGRKLTALRDDPPLCRSLLAAVGARATPLPPRHDGAACGYADGVRPLPGGAGGYSARFRPAGLGVACPVAAALLLWEREVVQPAALALLGSRVVSIDHFGSYSCRRLYGRAAGDWSEHAAAQAVDIAGVRLADGRRLTVARDWARDDAGGRFLHAIRDGACGLFATTLSPDYNAAHADHLHLDQAARGATGWRACR